VRKRKGFLQRENIKSLLAFSCAAGKIHLTEKNEIDNTKTFEARQGYLKRAGTF
jgi:hypothetical protein